MGRRLSTRLRVALTAGLVSAVVLGGAALWFIDRLESQLYDQARQTAEARATGLVGILREVGNPALLPLDQYPFEVVEADSGDSVGSCQGPAEARLGLAPTSAELGPDQTIIPDRVVTVSVDAPAGADAREYPYCSQIWGRTVQLHVAARVSDDGRYLVYAAGEVDTPVSPSAQAVVDTARASLLVGVPLAVLLIGAVAWFAVRGALRPVNAIRAEVAEISATGLDRRVPVPAGGDEISELAVTMNDMLDRVGGSVRRQQAFVADASHELRTPLASMRNQLEVLLTYPDRIDPRGTCAGVVLDIERLDTLITDLLTLARLDSEPAVRAETVDLAELATECVADRPRVTADTAGPVPVLGDRAQLERVVRNLVDNAARHANTAVTVSVRATADHAVLTVADDGPGIPSADRQRVFERLVRLDEARNRDDGGAGLGLAIVAGIVRAHRGDVEVAPGAGGAVLVVRLPPA
jgi:signal transduction histidine kinase